MPVVWQEVFQAGAKLPTATVVESWKDKPTLYDVCTLTPPLCCQFNRDMSLTLVCCVWQAIRAGYRGILAAGYYLDQQIPGQPTNYGWEDTWKVHLAGVAKLSFVPRNDPPAHVHCFPPSYLFPPLLQNFYNNDPIDPGALTPEQASRVLGGEAWYADACLPHSPLCISSLTLPCVVPPFSAACGVRLSTM